MSLMQMIADLRWERQERDEIGGKGREEEREERGEEGKKRGCDKEGGIIGEEEEKELGREEWC